MFRGASSISLDTKGRITIPTRYRGGLLEECQGDMVCTIDTVQPCLLLYPLHEWKEIELRLQQLSSTDPAQRRFVRLLVGYADDCTMDKSGRLLIAPTLRQHAGLEKKIMLVGQLNKFEIWSEDKWENRIMTDKTEIAEQNSHEGLSDSLIEFRL